MTIVVRLLGADEAVVLGRVADDVFDHAVIPARAAEFLADDRHHLAVALDRDTVVGMVSAVSYLHPDKDLQFWINEIGVAPAYRRRGIGKRLIEEILGVGRRLGCGSAWLGTEPGNAAANALYRSMGGEEEPFIMYSFGPDE